MSDILIAAVVGSSAGASKWHLGLMNAAGPKFVIEVVAVQVDPADASAVTGTGTGFALKRMLSLNTGTAVTFRKLDKLTPDAPTGVTALSNLTTPTAETAPELASVAVNTEETSVTASGPALWPAVGLEGFPVTLNNGDGIAVQQGALASAGSVDVFIYFRVVRKK